MLNQDIELVSEGLKAFSKRPRWILVDDTPAILEAVAMLLEALDCAEICKFHSAGEALEAFAADPGGFELVVTDRDMPEMNGLELCSAILKIAPDQKVLLATGSSEITGGEALEHGFCGMLKKPFSFRSLVRCLEQAGVAQQEKTVEMEECLGTISPVWAVA
jgi:DNA-binding NtrC family response regulator